MPPSPTRPFYESAWLTAFNSTFDRFEWLCTPMGLQPSSGHFQRFMEDALSRHGLLYSNDVMKRRDPDTGKLQNFVAVYQDDLVWWAATAEEHKEQIEAVFAALSGVASAMATSPRIFEMEALAFFVSLYILHSIIQTPPHLPWWVEI